MTLAPALDREVRPVPIAEAHAAIRSQLSPIPGHETVPLAQARGRILAMDLVAGVNLPLTNNSAVDGFAVRASDLAGDETVRLKLIGEAAAGRPFHGSVEPGQAIRIFTGAALPADLDTIIMQEYCAVEDDEVSLPSPVRGKKNWRARGEDVARGARALPAGRRLRIDDIALAGALGCKELTVFKRLQVGLFSTGDELCEPGWPLQSGQIWDANRCLLRGLLEQMGCEVRDFGILRDEPYAVEAALSSAARDTDLLITSGGMSVGREDHVRTIIRRRGTLDVWPLAIKPGKPVGLGDVDACTILALPGNPIAAVVAFIAIGRTVVGILSGASDLPPISFVLPAGFSFEKKKGPRQFLLAGVECLPGGSSAAVLHGRQGSAMLSAMSASSGFIMLAEDCERVGVGDPVEFVPLNALFG